MVLRDFFLMRRFGVSRAFTRSADMAIGSYPSMLVHIRYPENIGGAECQKRNNEKKKVEWDNWIWMVLLLNILLRKVLLHR